MMVPKHVLAYAGAAALLLVVAAACHSERSSQTKSSASTGPRTEVFGALREIMHEGNLKSRVDIQTALTAQSVGLGALSGLRGEVTLLGNEAWLSYPDGPDDVRTEVTPEPQEGAALLVTSAVAQWDSLELAREHTLSSLEAAIAQACGEHGFPAQEPVPFLIEGVVVALDWHVIDGSRLSAASGHGHSAHQKSSVRGRIEGRDVQLVGFYSDHHKGVFTHHDSALHIHVIDREQRLTGHVDTIVVAKGATLKLPRH